MRRLVLTVALAGIFTGCTKQSAAIREVSVEAVAAQVKAGSATVCDANDDSYREAVGVVPGAVLLTGFHDYDVKAQLPADKSRPLVFYCTSKS